MIFGAKFLHSATIAQISVSIYLNYVLFWTKKWNNIFGPWMLNGNEAPRRCNFFYFTAFSSEIFSNQQQRPNKILFSGERQCYSPLKNAIRLVGTHCWFEKNAAKILFFCKVSYKTSAILKISNTPEKNWHHFFYVDMLYFQMAKKNEWATYVLSSFLTN